MWKTCGKLLCDQRFRHMTNIFSIHMILSTFFQQTVICYLLWKTANYAFISALLIVCYVEKIVTLKLGVEMLWIFL